MLTSRLFADNTRLQNAANNAPAMRRDEPDRPAVRLLQQALRDLGVATMRRSIEPDGLFDGGFGGETFDAVRKFQEDNGLTREGRRGDGVAGQNTLGLLDRRAKAANLEPLTAATAATAPPPVETPATLGPGIPKLPSAARLKAEYEKFTSCGGKPCPRLVPKDDGTKGIIQHQCAIRMSIALGRCDIGFHMNAAPGVELINHAANSRHCGGEIDEVHDASSRRVFGHLSSFWDFTRYRIGGATTGQSVFDAVRGTPGIVYFDTFYPPRNSRQGGNHIDFFDGTSIMNDLLNYAAPGEPRSDNSRNSFGGTQTAIHFCAIPH